MKQKLFRHGDILLKEIPTIPEYAEKLDTSILAEGEQTGHNHKLTGSYQLYEIKNSKSETVKFLNVEKSTKLTHQEHNQLIITPGKYIVVNEREYSPFVDLKYAVRKVID